MSSPEEILAISELLQSRLIALCNKNVEPANVAFVPLMQIKAVIKNLIEAHIDSSDPNNILDGLDKIAKSKWHSLLTQKNVK